ncbi:dihydrolipoamide acetyltransferase family protein [Vannielia sp.]|uniref:dihydrolipoamide acetyltransferase family protein n=1 Tax=Vannielia sp. TaxID=2813045 RepID=UPI00261FD7BB|nr:dihydrolipoamide acetyltransferase family protein [Vannielia sp.]MDF1871074.1 dihydrolipoamide acetyltransferase family protein [Vannielia sp.]
MSQYLMPSLGSDMAAGTLVEQTIAPGEAFQRGDVIAAVETQKGVIEVEVFEDGILDQWLVEPGTEVPVGTPLARLHQQGSKPEPPSNPPELPPETPPEIPPEPLPPDPSPPPEVPPEPEPEQPPDLPPEIQPPADQLTPSHRPERKVTATRPRITPAARRLASSRGIDLGALSPPPDKVLTRHDIENLGAVKTPPEDRRKPAPAADMRAAIAAAMSRSKREIPHYYLRHRVDLGAVDAFLADLNATRPPRERMLPGALFARAIALALSKYPEFNGHYTEEQFHPSKAVNLGVAIHIRSGGLVAPALFAIETKSAAEVMTDLTDLVARVRAGRFKARELTDATITLTSLGERGVDEVIGVIYPPQVAIVGIGTPRPTPMVKDGAVVSQLATTLTLAADHRVSDGHRGALFLRAVDSNLQEPETL